MNPLWPDILDEEWEYPIPSVEIAEMVDYYILNQPDKRTKQFKIWKERVNVLIDMYNEKTKFKAFNKIK